MFSQLLDVFRLAANVDDKRPIFQDTERGKYIYVDRDAAYKPLLPELNRTISTVESLADVVLEESRRRENTTGNFMTVIFTELGGKFYPDDKKRLDEWKYERCPSQQWEFLIRHLGRDMKHLEFVRFLQGLRPSILNYAELMREFKKVTFDAKTAVTSQPIIENGQAGDQIVFTLETKSGHADTAMPGTVSLRLPFTRGGEKLYNLTIELDVALDENKQVKFRPVVPDMEAIIEDALQDEVEYFTSQVDERLPDLLVLLDY